MSRQPPHSLRISGDTELDRLVARSRLIGADASLVVHGGGNTSSKIIEQDHLGRERTVLRIKGSGTDLATIGHDGFPGLYLDELLPLRQRSAMSDEAMVAYLARCMVEPGSRRPSIETLLHAFLPARHVDHVHADAICVLTNNPYPERHVREALGESIGVVDYLRPGFELSRRVAQLADQRAVVLAKHGLVTWGETHEESYGLTVELVERAKEYLASRPKYAASPNAPELGAADRERLLLELRGRLSRDQRRILHVDPFQRALADRADVAAVATAARATPDHILRIGHASAVIRSAAEIDSVIDDFEQDYIAYFERNRHRLPARQTMLNPLPKVLLVPGLGCVAAGSDVRAARVNTEIAYRSHLVTATTLDVFGESAWLSEADIFDFEYWPLELAKLASAPAPRSFAGHVVIITGASSHDGPAVAQRLAAEGAHLVLVVDDPTSLAQPAASLSSDATLYVSPATDIVGATIEQFGGVDGLILLAPPTDAPLDRFVAAIVQQRLSGVVVAVGSADELATIGNRVSAAVSIRVNAIDATVDANPSDVAEAVAFLASDHARATRESVISVGAR